MQPHHHHDCDNCEFLGSTPGTKGPVDYYVCKGPVENCYIARYSSDGPDYSSESVPHNGVSWEPALPGPYVAYCIHQARQKA